MKTTTSYVAVAVTIASLLTGSAWAHELQQSPDAALPTGQTPGRIVMEDEARGLSNQAVGPWHEWDTATGNWGGARDTLLEHGVGLFGGFTTELWGNVAGGAKTGVVSTNLFEFGVEADLDKLVGWQGATFHNSWLAPLGKDLSGDYVGNLFTASNAAAFNSLFLYELWLQQNLLEDQISIRVGQLAADTEFAGSDYGSLFLNATFGWPPFLSENIPNVGPAFPKGTPGIRLAVQPVDWFTFQTAVYQGDPYADEDNQHGLRWHLGNNGYFWMNEAQVRWNQDDSASGLPGQAKVGFWYHSAEFESVDPASSRTYSDNHGVYLVVDQMLYREESVGDVDSSDQGLGWFGRIAFNPQDRNVMGFYFDTGLTYKGLIDGRDEDTLGIGVAYGHLSKGARRTLRADGSTGVGSEMVLEVSYQCQITPWMSVQPDLQLIIHPGATRDHSNAWVAGVRASVTF